VTRERLAVRSRALFCGLVLLVSATCTPTPEHSPLSAGAEPLRARFNQDIGKVRIVVMAAPT
jgi:hypothetical protein